MGGMVSIESYWYTEIPGCTHLAFMLNSSFYGSIFLNFYGGRCLLQKELTTN